MIIHVTYFLNLSLSLPHFGLVLNLEERRKKKVRKETRRMDDKMFINMLSVQ
jgi:hypothetical protein